MITTTQLDALLLLKHYADRSEEDALAFAEALLEHADDLLDAAVGYVAMQRRSAMTSKATWIR